MAYKDKVTRKEYSIQRPCSVCSIVKLKDGFNFHQQRCIECESKNLYKCCGCKTVKDKTFFPTDSSRRSGISSYCKKCKNKRNKKKITSLIRARWWFKGCLRRLIISKELDTFTSLGFSKEQFITKFPIIPKGKDIDHCIPLSWFKEGTPLNISCNLHNLQLLDSSVNYSKGNIFYHYPSDNQYLIDSLKYIKDEYLDLIKIPSNFEGGRMGYGSIEQVITPDI